MIRMMKVAATAVAATLALVACGGGGSGNYSTGGVYYTHEELASEFVRRVNVDVSGYDLTLVKTNTLQTDYIVVYDQLYGTYDAYWLGNYNVGENLASYLTNYDAYFYYDLIPQGGNVYEDYYSGIQFEQVEASSKNLAKMQALRKEVAIDKKAEALRKEYGLSEEKAEDVARFAAYAAEHKESLTNKDYDAFAKELTGSTITEFQEDYKNNNVVSLAQRIEKAGEVSGMGSDGVAKFIQTVIMSK
ncbi:MAG: hypothetical protein AB7N80_13640 [Bdellovibrionales bacterium]